MTSCEPERCFSTMKIFKSRVRSTMVEDRLNGLALIYIHPEVNVDPEVVVNDCALGKRKLEFVL